MMNIKQDKIELLPCGGKGKEWKTSVVNSF